MHWAHPTAPAPPSAVAGSRPCPRYPRACPPSPWGEGRCRGRAPSQPREGSWGSADSHSPPPPALPPSWASPPRNGLANASSHVQGPLPPFPQTCLMPVKCSESPVDRQRRRWGTAPAGRPRDRARTARLWGHSSPGARGEVQPGPASSSPLRTPALGPSSTPGRSFPVSDSEAHPAPTLPHSLTFTPTPPTSTPHGRVNAGGETKPHESPPHG